MVHDEQPTGQGEVAPTCHAPSTSLYLDQRGFARICAMNADRPLGNLARSTLHELWHGPVARELRRASRAGAWGRGCDACAWTTGSSGAEHAFARIYDELPLPDDEPEWPTHLELAMGNTCNLQCVMCGGDQSSAIRRHREGFASLPSAYPDRFFDELAEVLPGLERAKFLGGEPFLVREHHRVWDLAIELGLDLPVHITTNGTIWNERVERVLHHLPSSLAVSVDGLTADTIRRVRVGADPDLLFANLDRFQAYVEQRGTYLALTYCLMTLNWQELAGFLAFAAQRDLDVYVNTVTNPSRFSLYRLPRHQLAEVVAALDAEDVAVRPRLGRNVGVWDDQRARLRARLEEDREVPRWLRDVEHRVPAEGTSVAAPRRREAEAVGEVAPDDVAELRRWADGGPVAVVDLDEHDQVVAVQPAGPPFLHLPSDVRGLTLDDIVVLLGSYYGRRTSQDLVHADPGVDDVVWHAETRDEHTAVRWCLRPHVHEDGTHGLRLVLAARTPVAASLAP